MGLCVSVGMCGCSCVSLPYQEYTLCVYIREGHEEKRKDVVTHITQSEVDITTVSVYSR